jgi:hypothetical protein
MATQRGEQANNTSKTGKSSLRREPGQTVEGRRGGGDNDGRIKQNRLNQRGRQGKSGGGLGRGGAQ